MILSEEVIKLSDSQNKLIESGWGREVIDEVILKKIIYDSDNLEVNGFLVYPIDISKKYPLVIWNRGGNLKDGMIDDFLARGIFGEIASWGYVVLASQYRQADEFGGSDVNDVLNLIPAADEISFCDSSKIGMEGWSRGGMMAYKVLSLTDRINCAIIISGLADLFRSEEFRSDLSKVYKKLFGSKDENEFKERMRERSAVYFADSINKNTKILLIHGSADQKISSQDSVEMYEKLSENGIESELMILEGGDHYLRKYRKELSQKRRDWFDKYLK